MVQNFVLKNDDAAGDGGDEEEIVTTSSSSSSASPLPPPPRRRRSPPPPLSSSFVSWGQAYSSPSLSPSSICRRHTVTAPAIGSMITSGGVLAGNASSSSSSGGEEDVITNSPSSSSSNSNNTISRIFTTSTTTYRGKGSKPKTTIITRMVSILLLSVGLCYIAAQVAFVFSNTNMTTRMTFLAHDHHVVDNTTITSTSSTSTSSTSNNLVLDDNKNNPNDFALAYRQSFGFFHDVSSEHWKIHQRIAREYYSKHMYPRNPLQQLPLQVTAWYQENYDPNFSCAFERRIGGTGNGDGPKWVCDIHRLSILAKERRRQRRRRKRSSTSSLSRKTRPRPGCVVYSVGSNGDFTFEWGIQNAVGGAGVCEIHIFDPGNFGPEMPKELEATYHRWGIANETKNMTSNTVYEFENNQGNVFLSLEDTIKALGHEGLGTIDIFKIDCEGCEWDVYEDWLKPSLPSIQQILVEVHQAPMDRVLSFFDRLMEEGYVIFHKEPNIQYNPSCIEYGFLKLHKEFYISNSS